MKADIERRRTIRIKRSRLLECKLGELDRPAIKIAETYEEYYKSFKIVYEEYRRRGYAAPHPSQMLYNSWSLLPTTSIFVFKSYLDVISTVSLIRDSKEFGLPLDELFRDNVQCLRDQGRIVVEIGALATTGVRRWSNVIILLFRALLYYASEFHNVNDLLITVNPKHVRFYTQTLLFAHYGEARHYAKVEAPAVLLRLNLDRYEELFKAAYGDEKNFSTNLHAFFKDFDDPMLANVKNEGEREIILWGEGEEEQKKAVRKTRKKLAPYSVYLFLKNRSEILKSLTQEQGDYLRDLYHQGSIYAPDPRISVSGDDFLQATKPVLEQLHLEDKDEYTDTAFSRNLGLINYADQRKLLKTRVAIPGLGGVGGAHLSALARTGIGAFNLSDFDTYSPVNINRQYGSDMTSFTRSKIDVMVERTLGINPFLDIQTFKHGLTKENIDEFLNGVSVVVDSLDYFAQNIRRLLFNRSLEKNIPVITAAPAGYSCSLLVFMPGGMNYDQYFGVDDETDEMEQIIRFSLGLAPKARATHMSYMDRRYVNLYDKRVPSLDIGCQICAAMAATETIKIILEGKPSLAVPKSMQFDAKLGVIKKSHLPRGVNTHMQRAKIRLARRFLLVPAQNSKVSLSKPDVVPVSENAIPEEALRFIIQAGIQAPSGDNVQPWRFAFAEKKIRVFVNRKADPSFFNVRQAATLLSAGAVLQNMEFASGALGLESRTVFFPQGEKGTDHVATMHFTPTGAPFYELMESALWRRSTNRRMYSRDPVSEEIWERVSRIADHEKNIILSYTSSREHLKTLAKAVYWADRVRVERRDLHEHLMRMIHFTSLPKDIDELCCPEQFRSGMPLKNLQAGWPGELFLRLMRPWAAMKLTNMLGLGRMMPLYGGMSVLRSGGVGLICAAPWTELGAETALLRAGKAMQRVWCGLEHYGLAMQPLAAFPLLSLRLRLEGEDAFNANHVQLLQKAQELITTSLRVPSEYIPLFMFRVGKGRLINQKTYRHNFEQLLENV